MEASKVLSGVALGLMLSNQAIANVSKHGIGVSVNNGGTIYYPISSRNLRIEPSLTIWSDENKTQDTSSQFGNEFSRYDIGAGIYYNNEVTKNTFIYYGAKIGYSKEKQSSYSSSFSVETKQDGYFITPTIGAEYYITPMFSIGLDIGLFYRDIEGERVDVTFGQTTVEKTEETRYGSTTEVIVRYHF